ncbi:hypothetical protein [Streptantibioticus cattleyicolor]|uniref:Transcriptional regulator, TetR family protein n=1 Tax=Streptantibioticus cattleyicolor (strain ATCC 35852 / DSM 46488 / JCM 4925 / NBRC 14057 / NRRL 8057) TaxID=1003195 RepID=G8XED2_STREN|nr:hypothetical protein [Streptantibioticus cattleyicolor]AEW99287.1 transcriptional regulator, TetR family protein [Streptantibioticus cattleyicolor NRRL 8057 = DSM 46488]
MRTPSQEAAGYPTATAPGTPASPLVDKGQMVDNPDEPDPLLRLGLHRLPADRYPRPRATAPLLATHDRGDEFERGLLTLPRALRTP